MKECMPHFSNRRFAIQGIYFNSRLVHGSSSLIVIRRRPNFSNLNPFWDLLMKEVTGPVYIRYSILDWPLDRPFLYFIN